jgi:hypothetical protein
MSMTVSNPVVRLKLLRNKYRDPLPFFGLSGNRMVFSVSANLIVYACVV